MKTRLSERDLLICEIIICALPFFYYAMIFTHLPAEVPIHFDVNGLADRFVSKLSFDVFLLCALGYLGILVGAGLKKIVVGLSRHEAQDNVEVSKKIITYTQAGMAVFFTIMAMYFLSVLQKSLLPDAAHIIRAGFLVISIVLMACGNLLPKLRKNKLAGVRTSYSLSGDDEWMRAQRFGGRVLLLGGTAMLLVSLLSYFSNRLAVIIDAVLLAAICLAISVYGFIKRSSKRSK